MRLTREQIRSMPLTDDFAEHDFVLEAIECHPMILERLAAWAVHAITLERQRSGLAAEVGRLREELEVANLAVHVETELCAKTAADTEHDFPEEADEPRTGAHTGDYWNGFRSACEEISERIRLRNDSARAAK